MKRPEYREEPCRSAVNRVKGMGFKWSLNPYMGCAHQCTFCYVRAFERRAERPSDDRYGRSIRVKVNVAEVLARELARKSWKGDLVAVGAATDPCPPGRSSSGGRSGQTKTTHLLANIITSFDGIKDNQGLEYCEGTAQQ